MKEHKLKIGAFIALIFMFLIIVSNELDKLVNLFSLIVLIVGTALLTAITYQKQLRKNQMLQLISKNLIIVGCLTFVIGFVIALSSAQDMIQMGKCISVSAIVLIYMLFGLIVIKLLQELNHENYENHETKENLISHPSSLEIKLTQREKEIASYILKGLTNKEISKSLFVSESTIKKQITQLFKKLEVKSRYELISKLNMINLDLEDH